MDVAEEVQRQVCQEFGASAREMNKALRELRAAALRHPEIALYVKYNRSREGTLKEGDACPHIVMHALDGEPQILAANSRPGRPLVVIAGSYT